MKYCISVDWFQYYCHKTSDTKIIHGQYFQGASKDKHNVLHTYYVGQCQEFHSLYRDAYTIYIDDSIKNFTPSKYGQLFESFEQAMQAEDQEVSKGKKLSMVHVYLNPKMSSIDKNSVSVKVANRLLYKEDWSWFLHDIIEALHLEIKNITRIDLCLDFQKFAYQDMTPSEFIHRYIQDQSVATTETYVREGSNIYCVYGKKKMQAVNGETEITDNTEVTVLSDFEYIRFGSRNSGVCTYLYNKSKELRDKKSKPWIKQRWDAAGLDEANGDIFRLEFSISAKGMQLRRADTKRGMRAPRAKQIRNLCRDDVETQRSLEQIFVGYLDKYFSFRLVGKQKYRKDMKRVNLFEFDITPTLLPCYYNRAVNVGRSERNAALALEKLRYTALDLTTDQQDILYKAQNLLQSIGIWKRDFRDHECSDTYFLLDMHHDVALYRDRLVKQALTEVEVTLSLGIEEAKERDKLMLQNDEDCKEWFIHDPDGLIAY